MVAQVKMIAVQEGRSDPILSYILRARPVVFSDNFDVECERKRGVTNDLTFLTRATKDVDITN